MRVLAWLAAFVLVCVPCASRAAVPPPPADPAARLARTISQAQLDQVYAVLYTTIRRARFVVRDQAHMPPDDPLVHYDHLDGGHAVILVVRELVRRPRGADLTAGNDAAVAATGALSLAAIDAGSAGRAWKARYDRTMDRVLLGHALGLAFAMRSDRQIAQARRDVVWVHAHLKPGLIDGEAYRMLVAHHLTVTKSGSDLFVGYALGFNAGCVTESLQHLAFSNHHLTEITEAADRRCQ